MGRPITPVTEANNQYVTRKTAEAVLKGDVLTYDTNFDADASPPVRTVEKIDVDEPLTTAIGVAVEDAASGEHVRICISGEAQVLVDGTADVAIGDPLIASAGTEGEVILFNPDETSTTTLSADMLKMSDRIIPLEAQTTDDGTLTWCAIKCS